MQHSYEGLDRGGGFSRVGLLTPLRHRDFRLLWSGMCVSLLGDGVFFVALAWQVYALSNVPTALSLVAIAMTVPTIAFLLLGGVISDRFDRRRVMLAADIARGVVVGVIAAMSLTGTLRLWHLAALAALYGAGTAFFDPSFDAVVPEILPAEALAQANALDQLVRPIALRLAGPAVGGLVIAGVGTGVPAPRSHARSAPASLTSGGTHGYGRRSRARPSPTSCSWVRPRYWCLSSSRTD
jgi:DHA3 family tetracycline resistance protein-like MFS transporter